MKSEPMTAYVPEQGRKLRMLITAFGVVWLLNAAFQASAWLFIPDARNTFLHALAKPASVVPGWIQPLLQACVDFTKAVGPALVAGILVLIAILLGLALLTRWKLAFAARAGFVYSLICWVFLDGLGYPYGNGQTDPGVFMAYAISFLFVMSVAPALERKAAAGTGAAPRLWRIAVIAYGLLWLFDAVLKWFPGFLMHFSSQVTSVIPGQPHWVAAWLTFVAAVIHAIGPVFIAIVVALAETVIAFGLLGGKCLRMIAPFGVVYSLIVWVTAEAFGGPYSLAGTGVRGDVLGNILIYLVAFLFIWIGVTDRQSTNPGSLAAKDDTGSGRHPGYSAG